jgi:hypothetical protein
MRSETETREVTATPVCEVQSDSETVLGFGLILNRRRGSYQLHSFRDGRPESVGTFGSAADAWRALDELDAPVDI